MIETKPIPADAVRVEEFTMRTRRNASGCLEWTGSVNQQGYGRIRRGPRTYQAHRLALALAGHPLPDGMVVDHLCRNRRCVDVTHLEVVSQFVNTERGDGFGGRAIRARRSGLCVNGHDLTALGTQKNGACAECNRIAARRIRERRVS